MMGVLAAWALARELAPDLEAPALISGAGALVLAAIHTNQHTDIMATFCIVLAARVVGRTTGSRAGWADPMIVVGAVILAADNAAGALAATAFILAWPLQEFIPDAERQPQRTMPIVAGFAGGVAVAIMAWISWPYPDGIDPPRWIALAALAMVGGALLTLQNKHPKTRCDQDRRALRRVDLRVAAGLSSLTLAGALAAAGPAAVSELAPAWIALAVTGMYSAAHGLVSGRQHST
jgi:hypothetical protein